MSTLISTGLIKQISSSNNSSPVKNNLNTNSTPQKDSLTKHKSREIIFDHNNDESWKAPGSASRRASMFTPFESDDKYSTNKLFTTPNRNFNVFDRKNDSLLYKTDYQRRQSLCTGNMRNSNKKGIQTPLFSVRSNSKAFLNNFTIDENLNSPISFLNKGSTPVSDRSKSFCISPFYTFKNNNNNNNNSLNSSIYNYNQHYNKETNNRKSKFKPNIPNLLEENIKSPENDTNFIKGFENLKLNDYNLRNSYNNNRRHSLAVPSSFTNINNTSLIPNREVLNSIVSSLDINTTESTTTLYTIEFKDKRRDEFCCLSKETMNNLKLNKYVIVEADRGKDLGRIVDIVKKEQDNNKMVDIRSADSSPSSAFDNIKIIYREATIEEIKSLEQKLQEEYNALEHCRQLIEEYELEMEVMSCEYQFDRKKLTFYFVADKRIDFRVLVKDLFRFYKTRIWMCAVNRA